MSKPQIIIGQPWGGLGDNLAFSTLPQLYTEQGYDVYISSENAVRNQEIYDFVWGLNPYIKGIIQAPPNAGACKGLEYPTPRPMKNMELMHGLTEGNNDYPSIYYTPKYIPDLSNCLLFDATSISSSYSDSLIETQFNLIFNKYPHLTKKKIVFKTIKNRDTSYFTYDTLTVNNIYEYADMIYSCNVFVSTLSGQSTLSSTVKNTHTTPEIYIIHTQAHIPYKPGLMFIFKNTNYIYASE